MSGLGVASSQDSVLVKEWVFSNWKKSSFFKNKCAFLPKLSALGVFENERMPPPPPPPPPNTKHLCSVYNLLPNICDMLLKILTNIKTKIITVTFLITIESLLFTLWNTFIEYCKNYSLNNSEEHLYIIMENIINIKTVCLKFLTTFKLLSLQYSKYIFIKCCLDYSWIILFYIVVERHLSTFKWLAWEILYQNISKHFLMSFLTFYYSFVQMFHKYFT